ncbi:MAG: DUF2891 domain-containing protein [Asticcacaulis sp.]|uniref:DUF2891 domain-containing protein n=1 Tax=Asticcacaulis sp. TaxID=1872648 RepID=UPI0039E63DF5
MTTLALTPNLAGQFARIALGHVTREYPHKADHVMTGPNDTYRPKDIHPVFYGSFDWHSCVHGYWLLTRIRRLFPEIAEAGAIADLIERQFTPEAIGAEVAYLQRPSSRGFERPYGWAWLLKLAAELHLDSSSEATIWRETLRPLTEAFVARFLSFLPLQTYPVRSGVHNSTAFALTLVADYAHVTQHARLLDQLKERAMTWHGQDRNAAAWEPSGEDFLSPTLSAAQAMMRLLPSADFAHWLRAYLPRLTAKEPSALLIPARISDRSDGKIAHLDGLNLSRAWAWRELSAHLAPDERDIALEAAKQHLEAALGHVEGDYMGEHWLASFALLALTA